MLNNSEKYYRGIAGKKKSCTFVSAIERDWVLNLERKLIYCEA